MLMMSFVSAVLCAFTASERERLGGTGELSTQGRAGGGEETEGEGSGRAGRITGQS